MITLLEPVRGEDSINGDPLTFPCGTIGTIISTSGEENLIEVVDDGGYTIGFFRSRGEQLRCRDPEQNER